MVFIGFKDDLHGGIYYISISAINFLLISGGTADLFLRSSLFSPIHWPRTEEMREKRGGGGGAKPVGGERISYDLISFILPDRADDFSSLRILPLGSEILNAFFPFFFSICDLREFQDENFEFQIASCEYIFSGVLWLNYFLPL